MSKSTMRGAAFPTLMDRYIARLMIVPLAATLAISAMLLLLDKLRRLLDFVVTQGGSPQLVWRMLLDIIPTYVSFGLVLGLLLAVMLTFRRLALSAELDILSAAGVGYGRMLAVPFCYAAALMAANAALVGFVQPHSRYAYRQIEYDLRTGALGMAIKPGEFTPIGKQRMLRIGRVVDGEFRDVFLTSTDARGHRISISAARAHVLADADRDTLVFRLTDGLLVDDAAGLPAPRVLTFSSHDLRLPLPRIDGAQARGGDTDELTIAELLRAARRPAARLAHDQATANLNFRLIQIATLFVLPLMGIALAVPPKRASSGLGIFVGIVLLVMWYKINQYTLARAAAGRLDPVLGMWGPFVGFAALAGWLYHVFAHRIGGHPIAAVELLWRRFRTGAAGLWRRARG